MQQIIYNANCLCILYTLCICMFDNIYFFAFLLLLFLPRALFFIISYLRVLFPCLNIFFFSYFYLNFCLFFSAPIFFISFLISVWLLFAHKSSNNNRAKSTEITTTNKQQKSMQQKPIGSWAEQIKHNKIFYIKNHLKHSKSIKPVNLLLVVSYLI